MKPVKRSVKSRTTGRARVWMYVKSGLFWLRGYPSGEGPVWVLAPAPGQERRAESIALDRSVLRKATWTASKLYHKFPRALPAEVGDREAWWQRTIGILDLVKERINRDRPWPRPVSGPRKKIESLSKSHPALRPVYDALRWIHFGHEARCRTAVDALAEDAPRFVTMLQHLSPESGVQTILRLLDIRIADGPRPVRFLIDTLGDERAHRVPLVAGESPVPALAANIKRFQSRKASGPLPESDLTPWPDAPEPELAPALVGRLDFAYGLDESARRAALLLVALIVPDALLDLWATWHDRVARRLEEAWNRLHSPWLNGVEPRVIRGPDGRRRRALGRGEADARLAHRSSRSPLTEPASPGARRLAGGADRARARATAAQDDAPSARPPLGPGTARSSRPGRARPRRARSPASSAVALSPGHPEVRPPPGRVENGGCGARRQLPGLTGRPAPGSPAATAIRT